MTIGAILSLIIGVLKFPAEMSAFLKLIEKTPDQKRQEIVADIQAQLQSFEDTGRPS